jgi:multiple sugar transport system permease protein
MKVNRQKNILPYLLIAPALILLLTFLAYPMISNLITSFYSYKLSSPKRPFVGLNNYRTILTSGRIWSAVGRTFFWTFVNLFLIIVLGVLMALLLNTKFPGSAFLKSFMLVPWILPSVITGYIWLLMLGEDSGIITYALKNLHIVSQDFSWFSTGSTSMAAAIIANSWRGFPFVALMVFARLSNLSQDQVESACLEGATRGQIFRYITLPHIKPVLNNCILLVFIWTFNAYDIMRVMTNGGPAEKTTTMSILVYKEAFNYYSISNAAAISVVMFLLMLIIILLVNTCKIAFQRGEKYE